MTGITAIVEGKEELVAKFDSMPNKLTQLLFAAITTDMIELAADVKSKKLSGQVLRAVTDKLRGSINPRTTMNGTTISGSTGTNVAYARFWEKGFHGTENVRAHLREITQVFGHPIPSKSVNVRAHTRNVNQAPRPFLVPQFTENLPGIRDSLLKAVQKAKEA